MDKEPRLPALQVHVKINEKLYLKDPDSSSLGKRIIVEGIKLIDSIGFEQFTFKKLATEMGSTEASIYRYFENKHQLLLYLASWYWSWQQYKLTVATYNIPEAEHCLRIAIQIITHTHVGIPTECPLDMAALYRIVVAESPKAYLIKEVDVVNKEGAYLNYKRFTRQVADYLSALQPAYAYPRALISTLIESAHNQQYFSQHLPSLTEISGGQAQETCDFLTNLLLGALGRLEKD